MSKNADLKHVYRRVIDHMVSARWEVQDARLWIYDESPEDESMTIESRCKRVKASSDKIKFELEHAAVKQEDQEDA